MITFQIGSQQYKLQLDPNEPVKDTVEAFCLRHQIPHLRNQLLKQVRLNTNEENKFSQPRIQTSVLTQNQEDKECTFKPRINNILKPKNNQPPVHERLYSIAKKSKENASLSTTSPYRTKQKQKQKCIHQSLETARFQDVQQSFMTFNNSMQEKHILENQLHQLEQLQLLYCVFQLFIAEKVFDPQLKQFLKENDSFQNFNKNINGNHDEICQIIVQSQMYWKYIRNDLLNRVKMGIYSEKLDVEDFMQRYLRPKVQPQKIQTDTDIPKRYKQLLLKE